MKALFILSLCLIPAAASGQIAVVGPHADRVREVLTERAPYPADWHVIIVDEANWRKLGEFFHTSTGKAFTLPDHVTYIREKFVVSAKREELRFIVRHELGHIVCRCKVEEVADKFANTGIY